VKVGAHVRMRIDLVRRVGNGTHVGDVPKTIEPR